MVSHSSHLQMDLVKYAKMMLNSIQATPRRTRLRRHARQRGSHGIGCPENRLDDRIIRIDFAEGHALTRHQRARAHRHLALAHAGLARPAAPNRPHRRQRQEKSGYATTSSHTRSVPRTAFEATPPTRPGTVRKCAMPGTNFARSHPAQAKAGGGRRRICRRDFSRRPFLRPQSTCLNRPKPSNHSISAFSPFSAACWQWKHTCRCIGGSSPAAKRAIRRSLSASAHQARTAAPSRNTKQLPRTQPNFPSIPSIRPLQLREFLWSQRHNIERRAQTPQRQPQLCRPRPLRRQARRHQQQVVIAIRPSLAPSPRAKQQQVARLWQDHQRPLYHLGKRFILRHAHLSPSPP